MKELIKRPYVAYLSNKETVESVLAGSLFSAWYDEVADKNSFFYRFSAVLNSFVQDVLREQLMLFSEFMYDKLDVTEGTRAVYIDPTYTVALGGIRFRTTPAVDHLIGDVYLMGRVIPDLGQEEQGAIDQLRTMFGEGRFQVIDLEDINQIDTVTQRFEQIQVALLPGEVLLSGEQVTATNRGRIISFDPAQDAIQAPAQTAEYETLITGLYILLDPLTVKDTLAFYDQDGELIDVPADSAVIGLREVSANYSDFFDEDKDGFISQEDVQQLMRKVGVSINDVGEDEWARDYAKFDRGNKGIVTQADVAPALLVEGAVRETALIVRNPVPNAPVYVRYQAYIQPYITYATPNRRVSGGSLGLTDLLDADQDIRLADGFAVNTNNYVVGVNLSRNEIWFGRQTDTQYVLRKVSYPFQSNMQLRGFTFMDDVAFFILQAANGFLYKDLYDVALLRLDTLREVVEITTDLIPIRGATIEPTELITGCSITDRKDKIRFFTDNGQIITVQLERASLSLTPSGKPVGTPDLIGDIPEDRTFNNIKIFNAIDNYAYNVGLERVPFESNEDLLKRIKRRLSKPYQGGMTDVTKSTSKMLGVWSAPIFAAQNLALWNNIDPDSPITIEILAVSNKSVSTLTLSPFTKVLTKVSQNHFVGESVANVATESFTTVSYRNDDGDTFQDKRLSLGKVTLEKLIALYIKTNPKKVLGAPDLDEELIYGEDIPVRVTYSTIDPDGVPHGDISEDYVIDLPSIDSMKYYSTELAAIGSTEEKPLHPSSKAAKMSLGFYALHDRLTKEFFGDDYWYSIINYIRSLDKSAWKATEPGISAYDEKYATGNIVRVSAFNQSEFDSEQIEVAL